MYSARYDEAIQSLNGAVELDPDDYATLVRAVQNPQRSKGEALEILATASDEYWELSPTARSFWYVLLGENDLALESLGTAVDKGLGNMTVFRDPILDPLRADPRFNDLLERVGLSELPTR